MTVDKKGHAEGYLRGVYAIVDEVRMAYDHGEVDLHAGIRVRVTDPRGRAPAHRASTPPSVAAHLRDSARRPAVRSGQQDARQEGALARSSTPATAVHRNKATVLLADRLRTLGFDYAMRAGRLDLHGSHGHPAGEEACCSDEAQAEVAAGRSTSTRRVSSPTASDTTRSSTSGPASPTR